MVTVGLALCMGSDIFVYIRIKTEVVYLLADGILLVVYIVLDVDYMQLSHF